MRFKNIRQTALALTVLLLMPCALIAHDMWMIVDSPVPKIGEKVNVKVTVGHNFPESVSKKSRQGRFDNSESDSSLLSAA